MPFDPYSRPVVADGATATRAAETTLSAEQKELRHFYAKLLQTCALPAFTQGDFYGLNHANRDNTNYGRSDGEPVSGHWLYSFLRRDELSGQAFLVVANLNPNEALRNVSIQIPENALGWLSRKHLSKKTLRFRDTLGTEQKWKVATKTLPHDGLPIGDMTAMSALYLQIK